MITSHVPTLDFADSILYLAALLADQPRSIDHYIDYFGGGPSALGDPNRPWRCVWPSERARRGSGN
jgi:hypothetical protein